MDKFRKGKFPIFWGQIAIWGGANSEFSFLGTNYEFFFGDKFRKNSYFFKVLKVSPIFSPLPLSMNPYHFPPCFDPFHFRRPLTIFPKISPTSTILRKFYPRYHFLDDPLPLLFSPYQSRSTLPFPHFLPYTTFLTPVNIFVDPLPFSENINIFVDPYHFPKNINTFIDTLPFSQNFDPLPLL